MTEARKHPDLFTAQEAIAYLHLDTLTENPERTLVTLRDEYQLPGQKLGAREYLYHRRSLDALVDRVFGIADQDAAKRQVAEEAAKLPVPTRAKTREPHLRMQGAMP